jgi:hypothetical protein
MLEELTMRIRTFKRPAANDPNAVQWQVIEGGLRDLADGLPRVESALRDELSDYAVRFDAHVRRIRRERAATDDPVAIA